MLFYFKAVWSVTHAEKVPGADRTGAKFTLVRVLFASNLIEVNPLEAWLLSPSTNIS